MKNTVFKSITLFLILCSAPVGFAMNENSNIIPKVDVKQVRQQLKLPSLLGPRTADEADLNSNDQGKQTTSPAKKVRITRVIEPQVEMVDIARQLLELDHEFDGNNDNNNDDDADQQDDQPQLLPSALGPRTVSNADLNSSAKKTRVCDICNDGKDWKYASELATHMRTHTGKKPFKCTWEGCGKAFTQLSHMNRHKLQHTNSRPRPFKCTQCDKAFMENNALKIHMHTHTGERPFKCTWKGCGQTFTQSSSLTTHMKRHENTRSLICPEKNCGQAFNASQDLIDHMHLHTGVYPFTCSQCNKGFIRQNLLARHIRSKHNHMSDNNDDE